MRTLKLIARFYRGIFLANFLVTASCIGLIMFYGKHVHKIMFIFFWYKLAAVALIFWTAIYYQKRELYYYQNLGVSKLKLGLATGIFDLLLWTILIIITFQI